jgi:hypothetical protein
MKQLFLLACILTFTIGEGYSAQGNYRQTVRKLNQDSSILIREYRGSKLYASSHVSSLPYWVDVLQRDTILIAYFIKQFKDTSVIFISEIKNDSGSDVFKILARPQKTHEPPLSIGYGYYRILTGKGGILGPVPTLYRIEFIGIQY